jgi:hypothetical protein
LFNIAGHSWKGIRKTTKYAAGAALVAGAGYGGYEVLSNLPTPDVSWLKAVLGVGGIGAGIGAIGLVAANADRLWYMTKKGLQGIADGSMYAGKIIKGRAGKCFKAIGTKIDEKLERRAKEKSKKENRKMQDTFKLSTEEERFLEYLNNQAKKYFSGANVPSNFLGGGFSYGILTDHVVAFESNSRKIMIQKKYPFIQYLIHEYDKDPDRIYYLMPGFFAFINTHLLHEQDKITPARHELLLQERATEIYHQNLYKKAYSAYTSEDSFDDFVKKTKALSEEQKKKLFWKILYKTDDKNAQKDLWISENHSAMLESIASEEIEIKTSRVPESYFHDPDEFKEEIIELYAKLDCDHRIINRIQDIYSNILDLNKKFNNESLNQWYLDNAAEHMGSSFREDLEKIKYIKAGVPDTYFRDEDVFSEHVSLMKPSEARKAYVAIMDLPTHRRSWKHIKAIREKFPQATAAVDASRQKTTWYSW